MKNKLLLALALVGMLLGHGGSCLAVGAPDARPLSQTLAEADFVLVVRLLHYRPDNTDEILVQRQARFQTFHHPYSVLEANLLRPRGDYKLQTLFAVKGNLPDKLLLTLPAVFAHCFGNAQILLGEGTVALLLLKHANGHIEPVDPMLPLIPLAPDVAPPGEAAALHGDPTPAKVESEVLRLLTASLAEPTRRQAISHLLKPFVDPTLVNALLPFVDDPNRFTQSHVLTCLARNQYIPAIPRIAALGQRMMLEGTGSGPSNVLANYSTPEAVPYLNPLLLDTNEYTRDNALSALRTLADRSSVPYLLLALLDPVSDRWIAPGAYALLHKLIPELGEAKDEAYFRAHREPETRRIYAWWQGELSQFNRSKPATTKIQG